MANFINGWRHPIFRIYNNNILLDTIELPIVGASGLVETIQERRIVHELTNFTLLNKIFGYTIRWSLPYSEYANKATMLKIQQILRYHKAGYKIILTPRADLTRRFFEVLYTGEEIEMGIKKGGSNAVGNQLVNIEFTTKYLIDDINWIDPDTIQYIGFRQNNRLAILQT